MRKSEAMKIVYNLYPSAFQNPGGGEMQMSNTKYWVEKKGLKVDLFNQWSTKLQEYRILHTFGSVKYALDVMESARSKGVKNVLSTICWFDLKSAWNSPDFTASRAKNLVRYITKVVYPKFPSMRRRMFEMADILLPNSQMEADQITRLFAISLDKFFVVPNGVDARFADAAPQPFIDKYGIKDFILYVGRIEPRKNVHTLIKAMEGNTRPLVIIGKAVSMYKDYYEMCRKISSENIIFVGELKHDDPLLASAYKACEVFVLPTWFETPGLAALEAGIAGAKVVITEGGATKEYFKDLVWYVNPSKSEEISGALKEALNSKRTDALFKHIKENYLWEKVAEKTIEAYSQVLQND